MGAGGGVCGSLLSLPLAVALHLLKVSRASDGEEKLDVKRGDKHHPEPVSGPQASHLDSTLACRRSGHPLPQNSLRVLAQASEHLLGTGEAAGPAVGPNHQVSSQISDNECELPGCPQAHPLSRVAAASVPPAKSHANFSCAQPQPGAPQEQEFWGTQFPAQHKPPQRTRHESLLCRYRAG